MIELRESPEHGPAPSPQRGSARSAPLGFGFVFFFFFFGGGVRGVKKDEGFRAYIGTRV